MLDIKQLNAFNDFIAGVNTFIKSPRNRIMADPDPIHIIGSSRLLVYNEFNPNNPIILFIPSLINKHYILDLTEEQSLVRFLAQKDINVFMIAWNTPIEREIKFSCKNYINERVNNMINFLARKYNKPILLAGYCIGGLLALSSAIHNHNIRGITLLATPWNIKPDHYFSYITKHLEYIIDQYDLVPAELIRLLFYFANQTKILKKFINFANTNYDSKEANLFIATEHWVNDGIAVTNKVLHEIINLYKGNCSLLQKLCPLTQDFKLPALIIAPKYDRIVPYNTALELKYVLPNHTLISPHCGHIGMIIGKNAKHDVWIPLHTWIKKIYI
ncbi:MAG: alpha/beta fold hydrolase [Rickettsiales endosymbiont of Dermacentor nuttalli]